MLLLLLFRPCWLATVLLSVTANAQYSYWVVYNGDAPESCVVSEGNKVNDSCCTSQPRPGDFIADVFQSTCFVISGLLGDGSSLQSYLGCDAGIPVYGEACYNNGENGGIIPAGTTVEDTDAANVTECGCSFVVSGNGCHKIRDFSSLPGFESDVRQVFLYMNKTCDDGSDVGEGSESGSHDIKHRLAVSVFITAAAMLVVAM